MTVDEILARKRALLIQRREETDNFALFFLNEELRDLNAQLRALRGAPRAQGKTNSGLTMDRERYLRWQSDERDDELREAHAVYLGAVKSSAAVLTERQRELFDHWRSGESVTALAERFGVDKSTVSRTLTRSKARLRAEAEARSKTLRLEGGTVFDLADAEVARVLLSCLTSHQAVCLYLYYGEWLNLRECAELLGVDHTAVLRTVQRALRAIQTTLRCGEFTLDNADALGELAYALYVEAGMPDDVPAGEQRNGTSADGAGDAPPLEAPKAAWARRKLGYAAPVKQQASPPAPCTVRTSDGLVSVRGAAHRSLERPMSRLLTLLYGLRRKGPLYRWLAQLFAAITRKRGKRT